MDEELTAKMKKSMDASSKLGEYMLKGYTLLNLHCPICNCPLIQRKGEGFMKCVQCNREVITQEELDRRKADGEHINVEVPEDVQKTKEQAREESGKQNQKDNGGGGENENDVEENDDFLWKAPSPEEAERMRREEEISDKIGAKMLQGWAMLGIHCRECNAPLLRSRDGKVNCVVCEKVLSSEDGEGTKDDEAKESKAREEGTGTGRKPKHRISTKSKQTVKEIKGAALPSLAPPESRSGGNDRRAPRIEKKDSSGPRAMGDPDSGTLDRVANSLLVRLDQAQRALDGASKLQEISAIAASIESLAKALKAVQEADVEPLSKLR